MKSRDMADPFAGKALLSNRRVMQEAQHFKAQTYNIQRFLEASIFQPLLSGSSRMRFNSERRRAIHGFRDVCRREKAD
jgi:hypothetical protein